MQQTKIITLSGGKDSTAAKRGGDNGRPKKSKAQKDGIYGAS